MAATDQRPRTIAGVPPLGRGKGKETTFAGALEATLAVTAHPYDYATLMGVTGLAFRTCWFQGPDTSWCVSSPVGEFPEEIEAARRATGWDLHCECRLGEAEPHMEGRVPEIVASIDAGRPVLAYDPSLNLGVIYGYEEGGQTVLMHDYSRQEKPTRRPVSELGAMALFLGEHSQPMPRRDAVIQGLRMASQNWRRRHDPPNEERGYWLGEMALTRWSEDLNLSSSLSGKKREKLFFVSWWNLDCMADARRAAVVFLKEHLNLFLGGRQAGRSLTPAAILTGQVRRGAPDSARGRRQGTPARRAPLSHRHRRRSRPRDVAPGVGSDRARLLGGRAHRGGCRQRAERHRPLPLPGPSRRAAAGGRGRPGLRRSHGRRRTASRRSATRRGSRSTWRPSTLSTRGPAPR